MAFASQEDVFAVCEDVLPPIFAKFGKFFEHDRAVYNWVIGLTLVASLYDLLRTLPAALRASCQLDGVDAEALRESSQRSS